MLKCLKKERVTIVARIISYLLAFVTTHYVEPWSQTNPIPHKQYVRIPNSMFRVKVDVPSVLSVTGNGHVSGFSPHLFGGFFLNGANPLKLGQPSPFHLYGFQLCTLGNQPWVTWSCSNSYEVDAGTHEIEIVFLSEWEATQVTLNGASVQVVAIPK